ncbi:nucleotidyltransferase family protein [Oceanibaculum indicum]|uniref:Nucleotidyltransferase n=1 Tax=Oceanibaculum indicum P24 TaxID=1207063 RepID=K2IXN3_9PROT|nr:GSU2403 family nucleotidyltransferase fold protein [Oceanibaculum indicum]EKE67603.1 hypothetical protein P24_18386 [Oceanibaculum indicum P24]
MTDRHSAIAHAAYHDLLRSLLDDAVSELRGTPTLLKRNGRGYWYDSFRVGTSVHKRYIGEDSEALRQRIDRHRLLAEQSEARRKERTRLVRLLRAEGFLSLDAGTGSLLAAMAKAGVFRLGGTIAGTHAFRLYEGELGVRYSLDQLAQTADIDIASFERLSLALEDITSPPLTGVLTDFDFAPVPAMEPEKVWRWQQSSGGQLVEFLTPAFDAEEGRRPLAAPGVEAQALHHFNYLIAEPIPAAVIYRSGVLVQIPRPERFAIHKLIVSERRQGQGDAMKARKDVLQAEFLLDVLSQDRPDELAEAYEDARSRGPRWRDRLDQALERSEKARQFLSG